MGNTERPEARIERLRHPLSISCIEDGRIYELEGVSLVQTNLFLQIGRLDEVFVKIPSKQGITDFRRFVKLAQSSLQEIRPIEESERFERLGEILAVFPDLKPLMAVSADYTHHLAVHKLQYERLRGQTAVEIPQAKFGFVGSNPGSPFKRYEVALFQERVRGTTLWGMFDFSIGRVLPRWRPFLPAISAQLSELLDTGLSDHIDWNIKNFIFDEAEERLFYVDLKPTTLVARHSNESNLRGIRDHFLL